MNEPLILEHKTFISAKRAAEISGYASDYVGQLCRAGKLECKMVGRSWFITEESLKCHQLSILQDIGSESFELPVKKEETLVFDVPVVMVSPQAEETIHVPVAKVSLVPHLFRLPYFISKSYIFAPTLPVNDKTFLSPFFKISLGFGVFMIAFFFMFQSLILPKNFSENYFSTGALSASVASVSQEFIEKVFSFFSRPDSIAKVNKNIDVVSPEFNVLAVAPASGSDKNDEVLKQKIKDSFSDEVRVKLDDSRASGIVTPVFKKSTGDDFVYVLVPNAQ